jgi:hypothetical protein
VFAQENVVREIVEQDRSDAAFQRITTKGKVVRVGEIAGAVVVQGPVVGRRQGNDLSEPREKRKAGLQLLQCLRK